MLLVPGHSRWYGSFPLYVSKLAASSIMPPMFDNHPCLTIVLCGVRMRLLMLLLENRTALLRKGSHGKVTK